MIFPIVIGIILFAQAVQTRSIILLPPLSGSHPVGQVSIELVDSNRIDPFQPDGGPRRFMTTAFYPAQNTNANLDTLPPTFVFSGKHAGWLDKQIGLKKGTAARLMPRSFRWASIADGEFPVLLFSHGSASSREVHTSALEDLASYGWIIFAVSHPGDADFVEFPDGKVVINNGSYPPFSDFPDSSYEAVNIRVADLLFLLRSLEDEAITSRIPDLKVPLPLDTVGTFGHSFGGATAFQMLQNASNVIASVNLDGTQYSALATTGTEKPVVIMSNPTHHVNCDPRCDSTWPSMWPLLTGFRRELLVANITHQSYTDFIIYKDLPEFGLPPDWASAVGNLAGTRMREIQTSYLDSFFGKWLKGTGGGLLDGNSAAFPEISMEK